jgi:hypothetical protein
MTKRIVALLLAHFLISVVTQAQERQDSKTGEGVTINLRDARIAIPDLALRDQEGRTVRLYSDLIKDKVVVLSFFYTSCNYTCPMQAKSSCKAPVTPGRATRKNCFPDLSYQGSGQRQSREAQSMGHALQSPTWLDACHRR